MASIPRALRGLKPFLGMRLSADERTKERRESIWSFAQSNESSTLVGSDSLDTPFGGLSRKIRYAASLLYAKQPLDDSSEEPCQPKTPERKHMRPSLKELTWRTSSPRALKHKCSSCSTKPVATAASLDISGQWPQNDAAPHLNVFIPDSSLRGKTQSLFEEELAARDDPAAILSASEDDFPFGPRESTTIPFNQNTLSRRSLLDRFDESVTGSLDRVTANAFPKHVSTISTKHACQKGTAGGADINNFSELQNTGSLQDHVLEASSKSEPADLVEVERNLHVQFSSPVNGDEDARAHRLSIIKHQGTSEVPTTTMSNDRKNARRSSSARFPIRKRLSLRKSIERIHTKISGSLSPPKIASPSTATSSSVHEDKKDTDTSGLVPSMGSRDEWNRARAQRNERYQNALASGIQTLYDDSSDEDILLNRTKASASLAKRNWTRDHDSDRNSTVDMPISSNIRLAIEAIEKTSGDRLDIEDQDNASSRSRGLLISDSQYDDLHNVPFIDTYPSERSFGRSRKNSFTSVFREDGDLSEQEKTNPESYSSSQGERKRRSSTSENLVSILPLPSSNRSKKCAVMKKHDFNVQQQSNCPFYHLNIGKGNQRECLTDARCARSTSEPPQRPASSTESDTSSAFDDTPIDAVDVPLLMIPSSSRSSLSHADESLPLHA